MKVFMLLVLWSLVVGTCCTRLHKGNKVLENLLDIAEYVYEKFEKLKQAVTDLSRQVMLQQSFMEERIRSEGYSGLKLTRGGPKGLKNYQSNSHISYSVGAIHDHANLDRTIGMGEVIAVLNGVEFRTRHNDYKLVMPSTTCTDYHATEPIAFPTVPWGVRRLATVKEQIKEMQEWFRAFAEQNSSIRSYKNYFKPVLCYMEGAWTLDEHIEEPFESDRHFVDADSWFDLQEKIRLSSYTGTKSRNENHAYLPTTIMSVDEKTGIPQYAQWNYRILCYPIKKDIPLDYLRIDDDLAYRVAHGKLQDSMHESRAARYKLYQGDRGDYELVDEIFATIPGWDNVPAANLTHTWFGEKLYSVSSDGFVPLQAGYYHRWFKYSKTGAMGISKSPRGFNDDNLWVARTTQDRVAGLKVMHCDKSRNKTKSCRKVDNKFTFAIPLEIIYLTPLLTWNPYNLTIHRENGIADADQRNGEGSHERAYNGTDSRHYFLTPAEFFSGRVSRKDPADSAKNVAYVTDQQGNLRRVFASGTRVYLPHIGSKGVGSVRLRYPIVPIHGEGSSVWKELNALKYLVQASLGSTTKIMKVIFEMSPTHQDPPGEHNHTFHISYNSFKHLLNGESVMVTTTEDQGHMHDLVIEYNLNLKIFCYIACEGRKKCWDGHPLQVHLLSKELQQEL